MTRLLLVAAMLACIGLAVWGMARGWRARAARQAGVTAPMAVPGGLLHQLDAGSAVPGTYVATTSAGDLLDRIVVHDLASLGRADLYVRTEGVLVDRVGEAPLWIPRDSLRAVRLGSGQAQKAYEAGGVILIGWQLGDREVETGFRADDPASHVAAARAVADLLRISGGLS
jgi:ferric-dicitrate binding protein FerR (iron transport regulator)